MHCPNIAHQELDVCTVRHVVSKVTRPVTSKLPTCGSIVLLKALEFRRSLPNLTVSPGLSPTPRCTSTPRCYTSRGTFQAEPKSGRHPADCGPWVGFGGGMTAELGIRIRQRLLHRRSIRGMDALNGSARADCRTQSGRCDLAVTILVCRIAVSSAFEPADPARTRSCPLAPQAVVGRQALVFEVVHTA